MLLPAAVGLWFGERQAWTYLAVGAVTVVVSAVPMRLVRKANIKVTPRVGLATISLAWFGVPLVSALPMLLSGEIGTLTDSYFESVSGITTTGASVVPVIEVPSHATNFWRTYIQWMGGMGIVLVTVAIFPLLGEGGARLYNAEVPGLKDDKLCDYELWQANTHLPSLVLIAVMFIGGTGGSTGGGIKCIRFLLLFKLLGAEIKRLMHPRAIVTVKLGGQTIPEHAMRLAATVFFAWIVLYLIASLSLALMGIDAVTSLTAVAATLNNVGPGLGLVGPSENYSHLPAAAKWVLIVCMVAGRLELLSVFPLFVPAFWRR